MFCSQCGTENQPTFHFCQQCGVAIANVSLQKNSIVEPFAAESAIWNPDAAASWSLIFSPAFGSYIQMLNWRALGEPEKAAASQNWFYISLGMLAFYILLGLVVIDDPKIAKVATRVLSLVYLIVWYFSSSLEQVKYVKEKLGESYIRKPWGKALLSGLGAIVMYVIATVIVGLIFGIAAEV